LLFRWEFGVLSAGLLAGAAAIGLLLSDAFAPPDGLLVLSFFSLPRSCSSLPGP